MTTVKKLANLSQLRRMWWTRAGHAFINSFGPMMLAVLISAYVYMWCFDSINIEFATHYPEAIKWLSSLTYISLVLLMLPIALLMSIPLIMVSAGPFPVKRHIEQNQELRHAFGMSDEVEPEVHTDKNRL